MIVLVAFNVATMHASPVIGEYDVKAAFIYNFAIYIEWPEGFRSNPDRPFVVGVLGKDPFGPAIDRALKGRTVQRRAVVVKRFDRVEDALHCDILFIASPESLNSKHELAVLDRRPVLTIGDVDGFATRGGMINLVMEEKKVRFEINVEAMERAGLKPASQLLRLARIVDANRGA
jgi:hypothetical protein